MPEADKIKPFQFHGVDISSSPGESEGDCPFCGKAAHFYVETETGRWCCKSCQLAGNIPTFLAELLEASEKNTTKRDYQELSEDRGIPIETFKEWGVVKSMTTGEWLMPAFNEKGRLSNIFKAYKDKIGKGDEAFEKWKVISSPGCKLHPIGTQLLSKKHKILWVCEGPWDAMALHAAFQGLKSKPSRKDPKKLEVVRTARPKESLLNVHGIIAVPGAGSFSIEWFRYFSERECNVVFDNDHPRKTKAGKTIQPGWDGMKRIEYLLSKSDESPTILRKIRWGPKGYDPKLPDGYDIRDIFNDYPPVKAYNLLQSKMIGVKSLPKEKKETVEEKELEVLEPIERTSFRDLLKDYEEALHVAQPLQDTLAVLLACILSTEIRGDQIWLRIIGPPGSGKSTLSEAASAARDYVYPISNIRGLHSGFIGDKKSKKEDASLIPKFKGKTVIIKDGDTLVKSPNRDLILAEMRDLYDRTSRSHYRNRQVKNYEGINMTFVICGTDDIKSLNRTLLGERFLDVEILGKTDASPYLRRAITSTYDQIASSLAQDVEVRDDEKMKKLKRVTIGFINYLRASVDPHNSERPNFTMPKMSQAIMDRVESLGHLVAYVRARVQREGLDIMYRPRPELPTRLGSQFTKLAICLALVLGRDTIDGEVYRIVKKVALDTIESLQLELLRTLYAHRKSGMTIQQLLLKLRISERHIRRLLEDFQELGITQYRSESNRTGQRGRNRQCWELTPQLRDLYRSAMGVR